MLKMLPVLILAIIIVLTVCILIGYGIFAIVRIKKSDDSSFSSLAVTCIVIILLVGLWGIGKIVSSIADESFLSDSHYENADSNIQDKKIIIDGEEYYLVPSNDK